MASKQKTLSVVPDAPVSPTIELAASQKAVFEYLRDAAQAATQEAERRNNEVMNFLHKVASELRVDASRYLFNADDATFEPKPEPQQFVQPEAAPEQE